MGQSSTVVVLRNVRLPTAVLNSDVQYICASCGTTLSEFLQSSWLIPFPIIFATFYFLLELAVGVINWCFSNNFYINP